MSYSLEEIGKFIREVGLLGAIVVAGVYLAVRYVPRIVASIVTLIDSLRESTDENKRSTTAATVAICKLTDAAQDTKTHTSLLRDIKDGVGRIETKVDTLQLLPGPTVVQQINQHEQPPKEIT